MMKNSVDESLVFIYAIGYLVRGYMHICLWGGGGRRCCEYENPFKEESVLS